MSQYASSDWSKASAPIAQVLNEDAFIQQHNELVPTSQLPSTSPFSGKLVDLLLDTSGNVPNERKRFEEHVEEPSRIPGDGSVITLPQLPQRPAKTAKRPRIPPLLQGLHQPPPLPPTGRRFPPITDGVSEIERDICDRVQSSNAITDSRGVAVKDVVPAEINEARNIYEVSSNHRSLENNTSASAASNSSKPTAGPSEPPPTEGAVADDVAQNRKARKRKVWTDAETRDLLVGVSRFGIGSWKRILHCDDFTFHGRTAVDLKDRFRVCCSSEGRKSRHQKYKNKQEPPPANVSRTASRTTDSKGPQESGTLTNDNSAEKRRFAQSAGHLHQLSQSELAELGIAAEFPKSKRRARQAFSTIDDENLLKGFKKYGTMWHSIRDDAEYGFSTRHATDLRDRFRFRYPEEFAAAGCKLQSKAKPTTQENEHPKNSAATQASQNTQPESTKAMQAERPPPIKLSAGSIPNATHVTLAPQATNFVFASSGDSPPAPLTVEDGTTNPIILNRNILQWAEANSASWPTTTASYAALQSNTYNFSDFNATDDGLHINPLATLKLPSMAFGNHHSYTHESQTLSNTTKGQDKSLPKTANSASTPQNYLGTAIDTNAQPPASFNWTHFPRTSIDDSSRTPNLPTIVFPHVPVTSARTTVHNLPKPADLLLGMEDWVESQVMSPN